MLETSTVWNIKELLFYHVMKIPDCCCSPGSYLIVCTHVQHDRQALLRRHSSAGRVEGQLADWDAHSVAAQVSQPQDSLSIRHTDSLQTPTPSLGQSFCYTYHILTWCLNRMRTWTERYSSPQPKQPVLFPHSQPEPPTPSWLSTPKVTLRIWL